jgi:hypothetical protein
MVHGHYAQYSKVSNRPLKAKIQRNADDLSGGGLWQAFPVLRGQYATQNFRVERGSVYIAEADTANQFDGVTSY